MTASMNVKFVRVGKGRLALYHRPRQEDFASFRDLGCTHIITLLKESEGAERYGNMTREAGMEWVWLPVPNGKHPEGDVHERLIQSMPVLSQLLDDGNSMMIHCSAGIHRTGTVAYGLLRWRGLDRKQAMRTIRLARKETAEGMMEKRMRWGDENAQPARQQDTTWLRSVKEFVNHLRMKLSRSR
jgi:protein-tyrosine phosphatase